MKKLKTIIVLIGACMLLFFSINNAGSTTNTVVPTSEQTTSTEAEVKIGTQTWATKNLDVSTFRNGDAIPEAKTDEEWAKAGKESKPAWCYYDNDPENGIKFGKLYNWYAVNDPRGLAPKGWHVPTDAEWTTLTDYLGGEEVAGTKIKNSSGWNDSESKTGNDTNESGFAASPSGFRHYYGGLGGIGITGAWWSSSEGSTASAWFRDLHFNDRVGRLFVNKDNGLSVRCLRD